MADLLEAETKLRPLGGDQWLASYYITLDRFEATPAFKQTAEAMRREGFAVSVIQGNEQAPNGHARVEIERVCTMAEAVSILKRAVASYETFIPTPPPTRGP